MGPDIARLKENRFDFIHDSQKVFRILMKAMAFPGTVMRINPVSLCFPYEEYNGVLHAMLTLLDPETTHHVEARDPRIHEAIGNYLEINTNSRCEELHHADFILCLESTLNGRFTSLKKGTLTAPHRSATVLYAVDRLGAVSNNGDTELILSGPGIEKRKHVFVYGIGGDELAEWDAYRSNFPLGIDIYLFGRQCELIGIPRSVAIDT
ncbi:MAG: phosphonate C-P lyase system protein PhnH [Spirochaetales bacterium]|nr:phosphonate C-P lyase system protein PhnH [Spirochaetales bacterium]